MIRPNPLATALLAAGLVSLHPVLAQEAAAPASAEAASSTQLQEVVVTAQKRAQSVSKTALSLSVVTGDDLKSKGVSSAANLTEVMPNVQIGKGNGGGMELSIRGIGSSDSTERGDPEAAFHVDGIYIARSQGAGASFFDLERVEVLRGPQGTLYGRNANAGAVNVITRKPSAVFEGAVNAEVGSYGDRKMDAMLNLPVNDMLALRAVVSKQRHRGYADTANGNNSFSYDRDDQNDTAARLHGLLKFSPQTSLLLSADASRDRSHGSAQFPLSSTGQPPASRELNPEVEGRHNNRAGGVAAEFKTNLGLADLTYLYGHRSSARDEDDSLGGAPNLHSTYNGAFKQDSHELRLSSAGVSDLQWLAGLYAFNETGSNLDLSVFLPAVAGNGPLIRFLQDPAKNKSAAVFGQATYTLLPGLRGTLGLRYTRDEKSRLGQTYGGNGQPIGNVGNDAAGTWNKATYKLGVEYDLTPRHMLYTTLATGYKAGGFNDGNSVLGDANYNPNLFYKPESITSLETGIKGRYFGNRLQLSLAGFYYDYKDLQLPSAVNTSLVTTNAGKARVMGLEAEGRWAVSEAGRLNFALGLLDAHYTRYNTPNGDDYNGKKLDRAPDMTLSLGYTHTWVLPNNAALAAYLGSRYSSSYVLTDPGTASTAATQFAQHSFTKSDLTLTYTAPSDLWNVQAFVKNIENKSTMTALFTVNGANYTYLSEPRTLGVRAGVKF
jgi:iron complex outermembrane receptor protein